MRLDTEILESITTSTGENLQQLANESPLFLGFLRHFGCTFCREALGDIAELQQVIQQAGLKLVLVHMATNEIADDYLQKYKMPNVAHISDPDKSLYEYFGLFKGNFWQLYGLKVWARGIKAGLIDGHGLDLSPELGDFSQMPGIFIIHQQQILEQFIHRSAADRPDYNKLLEAYKKRS